MHAVGLKTKLGSFKGTSRIGTVIQSAKLVVILYFRTWKCISIRKYVKGKEQSKHASGATVFFF